MNPVATFNDAGMMLQAAEQGLGIALGRELLAADALCAGRLVQLSTVRVQYEQAQTYHLVYRPSLRDWPPLVALKQWLRDELELSRKSLVTYQPEDCAEGENQNRRSGKRRSANQDNALGQAQPRARPVRREARSCARARNPKNAAPATTRHETGPAPRLAAIVDRAAARFRRPCAPQPWTGAWNRFR